MPDRAVERAVALLVGRERKLERGVQAVDLSLGGYGRLVFLSGEAGIGKTRLAEEIAAAALADHHGPRGAANYLLALSACT